MSSWLRLVFAVCLGTAAAAVPAAAQDPGEPCCDVPESPLPPLPPDATAKEIRLRRIHDEVAQFTANIYLTTNYIDELRQHLAALGEGAPPLERASRRWNLAQALIRIGAIDETVRLLEECLAIAREHPRECEAIVPSTMLRLAVAHFRDAEKRNCIANHNEDSCIMPLSARAVHTDKAGAAAAKAILEKVLALPPHEVGLDAIWLLNIAHMALGTWPDAVPTQYRISPDRLGTEAAIGKFVDIARDVGLARHGHAGSIVIEDLTGDGRLDVLSTKFDTGQSLRLHRNDGDGRFTDITEQAGLSRQLGGINVVQADIDDDGMIDLLVLRGGGFEAAAEFPNSLLRQDRPGHFVDVTEQAGIEIAAPTRTAAFADVDRDGDLDLFIGYDSDRIYEGSQTGPGARERYPCRLFLNDGSGRFRDASDECGIINPFHCQSAIFGDVNGDGYPDLFLSNFMARNRLYMNRGDGTFALDSNARGVGGWRETGPSGFFDYDNDGDLDLFLTSCRHFLEVRSVAAWYVEGRIEGTTQELFENDGTGNFRIVTDERGLRRTVTATSLNFGDVDNDGTVDLFIGTGAHDFAALFPNALLLNGDRFRDVTVNAGVGHLQKCHGVAMGDLDEDGDLDIALSVGGFYQDDTFGDVLFRNPGNAHHWLSVQLHGTKGNRFGVGARVRVRVAGANGPRDLYQTIGMGASYGSNPLRAHFGLGAATSVEFVEVTWPATGETQRVEGVPVDAQVRIRQGSPGIEKLAASTPRAGR